MISPYLCMYMGIIGLCISHTCCSHFVYELLLSESISNFVCFKCAMKFSPIAQLTSHISRIAFFDIANEFTFFFSKRMPII